MLTITVNGEQRQVASPPDTPLLYVLRNELGIISPKFGCGLAQCGACSVLLDGVEIRSCVTPVEAAAAAKEIVTVEGLPARWAKQRGRAAKDVALHPVQEAWIEQQVPQCGFCQFGMMIKAPSSWSRIRSPPTTTSRPPSRRRDPRLTCVGAAATRRSSTASDTRRR
jgi:aerobic-type carbon monoxide dehydrogenase small subunit (CoxS/CutS family)